jgi:RNA polymerase sigma-70 factor, ECF subfamily
MVVAHEAACLRGTVKHVTPADTGIDPIAVICRDEEETERVVSLIEEQAFMAKLAAPATRNMLTAYGRRLTRNRHDAEDLAQTAILRAIEAFRRGAYAEKGCFHYWLIRVESNEFKKTKRKSSNRNEEAPGDLPDLPTEPSQEHAVCLRQIARAASAALSRECQSVLWIMAQGAKWDEAAAELDLPAGTVKSRTHRARATLHKTLGD